MILHAAAGFCCPSPTLLPAKPSWRMEKEDPLDIPLILHRRIGLQQEIAHWTQTEIERLHVAATYSSFASARSPLPRKFAAPLSRNATPSLPKPPTPFSKPPSPFTNQTECPLIPLYKGITGLPQQTEECCPRLPCVRGAGRRSGLRGYLPFLLPPFSLLSISLFPQKRKQKPVVLHDRLFMESGDELSSRAVTSQVLSTRRSLTSVFGMGTGGTFSP